MKESKFFFGVILGELILSFAAFWQKVNVLTDKCDIGQPSLPRKQRAPSRLDSGLAPPEFLSSVEDRFHQIYFKAIDSVIGGLKNWFEYSLTVTLNSF